MPRWPREQTAETRTKVLAVMQSLASAGADATSGQIARACRLDYDKVRWILDSLVVSGDAVCRSENRRLFWALKSKARSR